MHKISHSCIYNGSREGIVHLNTFPWIIRHVPSPPPTTTGRFIVSWPGMALSQATLGKQRRRNLLPPHKLTHPLIYINSLQYQMKLGLRICISDEHSHWSFTWETINPGMHLVVRSLVLHITAIDINWGIILLFTTEKSKKRYTFILIFPSFHLDCHLDWNKKSLKYKYINYSLIILLYCIYFQFPVGIPSRTEWGYRHGWPPVDGAVPPLPCRWGVRYTGISGPQTYGRGLEWSGGTL